MSKQWKYLILVICLVLSACGSAETGDQTELIPVETNTPVPSKTVASPTEEIVEAAPTRTPWPLSPPQGG